MRARRDAQTIYDSVCTDNAFARMRAEFFEEDDTAEISLNLNRTDPTS